VKTWVEERLYLTYGSVKYVARISSKQVKAKGFAKPVKSK
jgi:hypothetical protein